MEIRKTRKEKKISRRKSNVEVKSHRVVKSDILFDIMPIYHISKICGLLPVRFILKKSGRYICQVVYSQVGYGIVLALALTGCQCYGIYDDLRDGWKSSIRFSSKSLIIINSGDLFSSYGATIAAILGSPYHWRLLRRALIKLVNVDEKLGASVTSPSNLRKLSVSVTCCTLAYLFCVIVLQFSLWGILNADTYSGGKGFPFNYVPLYFAYLINVSWELQYAVVLFNVAERFRKLNEFIENLGNNSTVFIDSWKQGHRAVAPDPKRRVRQSVLSDLEKHRSNGGENVLVETLDQLITLHGGLCDSVNCANKAYGVAILAVALDCLVHFIISVYLLYNFVYSPDPSWLQLITQFFIILLPIIKMVILVQPCHMVALKANRTGALVNQASTIDWSDSEVKIQLRIFSIQVVQRPIEFTACGLFYLNRGLLTSLVGSATTYLAILLQFHTADETEGTETLVGNVSKLIRNVSNFNKY